MDTNREEINIDNLRYSDASKYFDAATFSVNPFVKVETTAWGERHLFTPEGLPYAGSELRFNEGGKMEEVVNDRFRILVFRDGRATLKMEDPQGNITDEQMEPGLGYRLHKGQRFSIEAHVVSRILEGTMSEPWGGDVHRDHFTSEEYVLRIGKPWGHELHFAKEDDPLMVKILHINAGDRLSEKAHRLKRESYWILDGQCNVISENSERQMLTFNLEYDKGYTTNVGQRHRQQAVTDCAIFEVSTPERGKTWRIQDDYERPDETDAQRKLERNQTL
jgi:hypothetical protein